MLLNIKYMLLNAFGTYCKSSLERFSVYNLVLTFYFWIHLTKGGKYNRNYKFIKLFNFFLFLIKEKVTKICDQDGHWFRHPDSNRTWTNYTLCNNSTHEKVKVCNNRELKFDLHFKIRAMQYRGKEISVPFHSNTIF